MTTHTQRMQACLLGETADRTPVALWRHFPGDDQQPASFAAATLHWQKLYDWDLVKVTPASSFALKDWGSQDEWRGDSEGTRSYTHRVINAAQDWQKLGVLGADSPHLRAQIEVLRTIRKELGPDTPLLQTIFSPLSQAKNLAGGERLIQHLRLHPQSVKSGLEIIAQSTANFMKAICDEGLVDGVFYAVQHAQAALLSPEEFRAFGRDFDLQVLSGAADLWCNMVHLHGEEVYFDEVANYPVQIINWHDRDTFPTLAEAKNLTNSTLCGGLGRESIVLDSAAELTRQAQDALRQTGGTRFLLGTGCVVPVTAAHGNLSAVRRAVE